MEPGLYSTQGGKTMNKKIKKVIVVALTISILSTIQLTNCNLGITKAYADSSDVYLKSIYLSDGTIDFSKTKNSYDINVANSVDEIKVSAKPDCLTSHYDDYEVDINGYTVHEEDNFRETVSLDYGENIVKITIIKEKDDSDDETIKRVYTLYINRGSSDSSDQDDMDDDIYLDSLSVSGAQFSFSPQRTVYNVSVAPDLKETTIRAKPEFEDSTVEIDGMVVDDKDKYKNLVQLREGKNVFKVNVQDDDNLRTYTLNITKEKEASNSSTSNTSDINNSSTSNSSVTGKYNQWINENGVWKYNDITGNSVKNTWFFDKNYGKAYYLKADGSMAIGWLLNNEQWYYLDESGAKQIGWKLIAGKWYYFDEFGIMKKNTTIGKFKLGTDGAWIK